MPPKLTIPQHKQIISLYQSGMSIHQIAPVVGCRFQTVSKHLKKASLEVRDRGLATAMGRGSDVETYLEIRSRPKAERVDPRADDKRAVAEMYLSGSSFRTIHRKLGVSMATIRIWLEVAQVERRSQSESCRRHPLNQTVFNKIDTDAKAYWLGFLTADGSISPRGEIWLGLQLRDRDHLERFRSFLETTIPVRTTHKPRGYTSTTCCYISVHSLPMCADLVRLGVYPRKTQTLSALPTLPSHLFGSYLRGVFDGDGSWGIPNYIGAIVWRLAGNREYLLHVQELMVNTLGLSRTKLINHHTTPYIAYLSYCGTRQVSKIAQWMYGKSTIHLDRKLIRLRDYLQRFYLDGCYSI